MRSAHYRVRLRGRKEEGDSLGVYMHSKHVIFAGTTRKLVDMKRIQKKELWKSSEIDAKLEIQVI